MEKVDAITSYTQKLLEGYENKSEANNSEASNETTLRSSIAVQDMFGAEEVARYNKNPVKGKRYLIFTVFMVIILSGVVIYNSKNTTLEEIANQVIKNDQ